MWHADIAALPHGITHHSLSGHDAVHERCLCGSHFLIFYKFRCYLFMWLISGIVESCGALNHVKSQDSIWALQHHLKRGDLSSSKASDRDQRTMT